MIDPSKPNERGFVVAGRHCAQLWGRRPPRRFQEPYKRNDRLTVEALLVSGVFPLRRRRRMSRREEANSSFRVLFFGHTIGKRTCAVVHVRACAINHRPWVLTRRVRA